MGHCRFREIICKHMVERRADTKWKDTRQHLIGFDSGSFGVNPNPPKNSPWSAWPWLCVVDTVEGEGAWGSSPMACESFSSWQVSHVYNSLISLTDSLHENNRTFSPPPPPLLEPLSHGWKTFRRQLLVGKTPEHKSTDRLTPVSQPPYSFTVCIRKKRTGLVCVPV